MNFSKDIHAGTNRELLIFAFLLALFIVSCRGNNQRIYNKRSALEVNSVLRAKRFSLDKNNDYTKVTIINPWQGAINIKQEYYLIKNGSEMPDMVDSSEVIFVPLKSIICMSTTHIAMIAALGEENTITGVSGTDFIYSDKVKSSIEKGHAKDVGYEANLNKELIFNISPDLIMMYGVGSESVGYVGKIREMGIKVIFNADYLETDPLSKAEWIKLFGALYCKESLADSIYNSEVEDYIKINTYINKNIRKRPKVLLGLPFKDTWYVSPGNSFISELISDAGGDYLWQNTKSAVSMPLGIENVYLRALDAEFWFNIGTASSLAEISMVDKRLTDLPCFKNGNLYNNNKRISANGGNDYWESGAVYPHIIMKDIASILHPDLFTGHELFFYRKIQ